MADDGVFIDIFGRLNMASMTKVLADVVKFSKTAGGEAGKGFAAGQAEGIGVATAQYKQLAEAATTAYRDMEISYRQLAAAERQIGELRAQNFKRHTEEMIAAQRELDAAILNSNKLTAAAAESSAAAAAAARGGGRQATTMERAAPALTFLNRAGAASAVGGAIAMGEGLRVASDTATNMQEVLTKHQDTLHTQAYIADQTQKIYQMSSQVPWSPQELSKAYQSIEAEGYRGQQAIEVLKTSAMTATAAHTDLGQATNGLTTSLRDLGVMQQIVSDNAGTSAKGLSDMNVMAGQLVQSLGQLKHGTPDQLFDALGKVEPGAMVAMSGVSGPQQQAQINTALTLLSRVGIGPDQGAANLSRIMTQFGSVPPGSKQFDLLAQVLPSHNPEDVAAMMHSQGLFPVFNMLGDAFAKRTGPDGKIDIGFKRDNAQIQANIDQLLGGLDPSAQAYLASHPEIMAGNARQAQIKKDAKDQPWGQDIIALGQWEASLKGENRFVKQGSPERLFPAQVANLLAGSGDIARTFAILLESRQQGTKEVAGLTSGGQGSLEKSFQSMMGLPSEQWAQFKANLQALTGILANNLLPVITRWAQDINGFLGQHSTAAKRILEAMLLVGAAWMGVRAVILAANFVEAFSVLKGSFKALGSAAMTASGEIAASGLGGALKGAAANVAKAFGPAALAAALSIALNNDLRDYARQRQTPEQNALMDALDQHQQPAKGPGQGWDSLPKMGDVKGPHFAGGGQYAGLAAGLLDGYSPGYDNMLAATSGGVPVALSGGEGILTPETARRLGGKAGIDALNSGADPFTMNKSRWHRSGLTDDDDPWADPLGVGSTFFGSFAEGMAKTSPWGKFLTGPAQTLQSLAQQSKTARGMNEEGGGGRGPSARDLEQYLVDNSTPEELQAMGITKGKRGGWQMPNGKYLPESSAKRAAKGGAGILGSDGSKDDQKTKGIVHGLFKKAGYSDADIAKLDYIIDNESHYRLNATNPQTGDFGVFQFNPAAGNLARFLPDKSQNPFTQAAAGLRYIQEHYGGSMDAAYQAKVAQGWYASGGVIPHFDDGGIVGNAGSFSGDSLMGPHAGPAFGAQGIGKSGSPPPRPPSTPAKSGSGPVSAQGSGSGPRTTPTPPRTAAQGAVKNPNQAYDFFPPVGTSPTGRTNPLQNPSRQYGIDNKSQGFQVGGGILGSAEGAATQAASMAANAFAPGSGAAASQAAQIGFQLANRAIGYAGQLAGIGVSGLMETFLPNNSPLADPSHNLFGKIAMGISGMHPTEPSKNMGAMNSPTADPLQPRQDLDAGLSQAKLLPQVHMPNATIHNHGSDHEGTADAFTRALARSGSTYTG